MVKLKFRLRTLFVLTAVAALICLCIAPSEKSPFPSVWVQVVYAPSPYPVAVNRRYKDFETSFYATLLRRLSDERKIDISLSADPIVELRKLIRVKLASNDVNSIVLTISAWPTPHINELDDIEEILGTACEVIQGTQLLGTSIELLPF